MIKRVLFLFFFIAISEPSFAEFNNISLLNKIEIENYYDSNIIKLSSKSIDDFKHSVNPAKFHINSVDDIVTSVRHELGIKHRLITGHTQIDRIIFKYNKFWNNSIKNYHYFGAELKQYFSRNFNILLKYLYFPHIYINHYNSLLDDENIYRKFSYSKNIYRSGLNLKLIYLIHFGYQFEYSQNYYNKYFGEYDSDDFKNLLAVTIFPYENLRLKFRYSYKQSLAQADKAFDDITGMNEIRDPSYESDIYYGAITIPIKSLDFAKDLRLFISLEFENRFFQSKYLPSTDPYHSGRKDNIFKFEGSLIYPFFFIFDIKVFYNFETRNVSAPAGNFVSDEKEYSVKKVGFGIKINFD
ncbi:MAG: hypothetical protein U9R23_01050 [Candidatus Cloacimonadota bacterium]|nr:hypothetical protein [Candidatus Cloacimonadota bacterium]